MQRGRVVEAASWSLPIAIYARFVSSNCDRRPIWLLRGDLGDAVRKLKQQSGKGLLVSGVMLPLSLAELGLIDEYEFMVHPVVAGHGPTLLAGLSKHVELQLVSREEIGSKIVSMRYEPKK